jgi:hypothetical protein
MSKAAVRTWTVKTNVKKDVDDVGGKNLKAEPNRGGKLDLAERGQVNVLVETRKKTRKRSQRSKQMLSRMQHEKP